MRLRASTPIHLNGARRNRLAPQAPEKIEKT
jgi:hypothetical protein